MKTIETRDLWEIKNLLDYLLNNRLVRDRDHLNRSASLRKMVGQELLARRDVNVDDTDSSEDELGAQQPRSGLEARPRLHGPPLRRMRGPENPAGSL